MTNTQSLLARLDRAEARSRTSHGYMYAPTVVANLLNLGVSLEQIAYEADCDYEEADSNDFEFNKEDFSD
jgi:hypothetical protein